MVFSERSDTLAHIHTNMRRRVWGQFIIMADERVGKLKGVWQADL